MPTRTGRSRAGGWMLLAAVLLAPPPAGSAAEEPRQPVGEPEAREQQVLEGEFLYQLFCRSCHDESATGHGPVEGELTTPPADLTRISLRNEGPFPAERVHRRIDGRAEVPAHGPSDMPVWGFAFQQRGSDADQEVEVRRKISQLVAYLESIQVSEDP